MFDIGFWELMLVAVIAIVVVGPAKLPEVVRTVVIFVRKIRNIFNDVKSDIEKELELDDLRRQLNDEDMQKHMQSLNQSILDAEKKLQNQADEIINQIDDTKQSINQSINSNKADD